LVLNVSITFQLSCQTPPACFGNEQVEKNGQNAASGLTFGEMVPDRFSGFWAGAGSFHGAIVELLFTEFSI
jgi:hypothetical protein